MISLNFARVATFPGGHRTSGDAAVFAVRVGVAGGVAGGIAGGVAGGGATGVCTESVSVPSSELVRPSLSSHEYTSLRLINGTVKTLAFRLLVVEENFVHIFGRDKSVSLQFLVKTTHIALQGSYACN